jgi:hypothetical protein
MSFLGRRKIRSIGGRIATRRLGSLATETRTENNDREDRPAGGKGKVGSERQGMPGKGGVGRDTWHHSDPRHHDAHTPMVRALAPTPLVQMYTYGRGAATQADASACRRVVCARARASRWVQWLTGVREGVAQVEVRQLMP